MPSVTVVVPTWLRAGYLARCLDAVAGQSVAPDEVVVAGRPVDVDARRAFEQWQRTGAVRARWVDVPEPGHVAPVVAALATLTTDLVAFLDDDAEPTPRWLSALTAPFTDRTVACVGGAVFTPSAPPARVARDAGCVRWYGRFMANVGSRTTTGPTPVSGVMEGNACWRVDALRALDFEPLFQRGDAYLYGLDLCLQASARGWRVLYDSSAEILHHAAPRDPDNPRDDRSRVEQYSRNWTYIALRRLPRWQRPFFVVWWWGVGDRRSYGLVKGVVDIVMGRARPGDVRAAFRAKASGLPGRVTGARAGRTPG